ncbi:putative transporter C417,10 [Rhizoctonia solani AG-1 IB]|uniref:Putative transporter C417,10 n=1 Tax=Thanatephorus cucumeris (strain AG1-IB / isolate 7/3/14) TaxID=1108050 RepID=M5C057_THACB|nr:putative transporter C417,10 [Rhizoctonia solani AG-1 IB]
MSQPAARELRIDDHMKVDIEDSKLPAGYKNDGEMSLVSSKTGDGAGHNAGIDAEVANFFAAQEGKNIVIDEATNKRLKRMIDKRVLLVMVVTYFLQTLDKGTINFASIMGIQQDTHLVGQQYSWLTTCLYIAILVWEFPTNRLLQVLPVAKYLAFNITAWGIVLACTAACRNFTGLVVVRTLLGMFECVCQPGFVLLSTMWYTKKEQAITIGCFYAMNGLQQCIGGLLAYGVYHIRGGPITSWQVLFTLLGCLTFLWGLFVLWWLPDSPMRAHCFSPEDRVLMVERVRANETGIQNKEFKRYQALEALKDLKTWCFYIISFTNALPTGGLGAFSNLIIKDFGFSTLQTDLLAIAQGVIIMLFLFTAAYFSTRTSQKCIFMFAYTLPNVIGSIVFLTVPTRPDTRVGLLIAFYLCQGFGAVAVLNLALVTGNTGGRTKQVVTVTGTFITWAVGNAIGPQVFRSDDAPRYPKGFAVHLVMYGIQLITIVVLRLYLLRQNVLKRRAQGVREEAISGQVEGEEKAVKHSHAFDDLTDRENPDYWPNHRQKLISDLFAKIQSLEDKLEVARDTAHAPTISSNQNTQPASFAASAGNQEDQDTQISATPAESTAQSTYEVKKAQAQGQVCNLLLDSEQCWYEHPGSNSAGILGPSSSDSAQAGRKQECNYGVNCRRKQCWFEHPSGWTPPNHASQDPQSQQVSDTEIQATEITSQETNGDLSGWGDQSTNDWSTPVDNTWGTPADNGWGDPAQSSWNAHPSEQPKSSINNLRSKPASTSREGSVSTSTSNKAQGNKRGSRGKARRVDSGSVTTESTPLSPRSLAPAQMTPRIESVPLQPQLSPQVQPTDQSSSYNESNATDEMNTPPLEPSGPWPVSEPEAPGTPKALWSDEPNIDVAYYPDPPANVDEQPSVLEDSSTAITGNATAESLNLDQYAPSDLYSSWGVAAPSASDWGMDPNEYPDPAPTNKQSKSKGKQKDASRTSSVAGKSASGSSKSAARSETRLSSTSKNSEVERTPQATPVEPPQGVPQDEIPDWLLGVDEDPHTALGIPRAVSPSPEDSSAPSKLAPTNPPSRPPLSKLAGENFPRLNGFVPPARPLQPKDDASAQPTFTPRPVGWKITRTSDTSSRSGKSKNNSNK